MSIFPTFLVIQFRKLSHLITKTRKYKIFSCFNLHSNTVPSLRTRLFSKHPFFFFFLIWLTMFHFSFHPHYSDFEFIQRSPVLLTFTIVLIIGFSQSAHIENMLKSIHGRIIHIYCKFIAIGY